MKLSSVCVIASIGLAAACGSGTLESGTQDNTVAASSTAASTGAGAAGGAGGASSTGGGGVGGLHGDIDGDKMLSGEIILNETATVMPTATLTIAAGTVIRGAPGAQLMVQGKLNALGTAAAPVVFQSTQNKGANGWGGLENQPGGDAKLDYVEIHDAKIAFQADQTGTYSLDHLVVDTSSTALRLNATGTISHAQLHSDQSGDAVVIGAKNNASPQFTDVLVDNGNVTFDQVQVSGVGSAPTFDHVEVSGGHAAFRFDAGKNIVVSASYIHGAVFGIMILGTSNLKVTGNNFEDNQTNLGDCQPAVVVDATGNYFGGAAYDASCNGQPNTAPAGSPLADVGPRP